jgi:hypothetical protein
MINAEGEKLFKRLKDYIDEINSMGTKQFK